jgi:hypothetical protein
MTKFGLLFIFLSFQVQAQDFKPVKLEQIDGVMTSMSDFKGKFSALESGGLPRQKRCLQKCSTFKSFCENGKAVQEAKALLAEAENVHSTLANLGSTQSGETLQKIEQSQMEIRLNRNRLNFSTSRCEACKGKFNDETGC